MKFRHPLLISIMIGVVLGSQGALAVTTGDLPDGKPELTPPSESTVFLGSPRTTSYTPTKSSEIYYSEKKVDFNIDDALDTLSALNDGINEISDQIRELDKNYKSTDKKYTHTRQEVMQVINDIVKTKKSLEVGLQKIRFYQRVMLKGTQQIEAIRQDIKQMKEYIVRFSNFLYKLHNNLYTEEGEIDNIKLFLKTEGDISGTISNTYFMETLVKKIDELVEKLGNQEKSHIKRIKQSNQYKIDIRTEILAYKDQLDNLEQKRKYLTEYLALYKDNKEKMEGTLSSLFNTRKDTHNSIVEAIEQIRSKKYITSFDMKSRFEQLRKLKPYANYEDRVGDYSWPLTPVSDISTYFKESKYKEKYGIHHYGIEIPSPQRSPVYATADGIVYKVHEDILGVNRMLLVHNDATISVYQYLNNFFVKEGEIVRRGELIGHSGGTPGTPGAGFISKQPNLTFMMFQDGSFVDPLSLLDLSIIKNKGILAQKYHIKYLKDLYNRPRDIYKIEFMKGDTLTERRVEFLETYGVGVYREEVFWRDAAMNSNVDLDVGICIGFAESTLGNYLTTDGNIGNVGNNDRGDRVGFNTALAGATAIYDTLNNTYLGHYNTLLELNGYGNKQGKIYASSEYNWQNNVIKCLSMIKGYYVPDDYSFRTGVPMKVARSYEEEDVQ